MHDPLNVGQIVVWYISNQNGPKQGDDLSELLFSLEL